ncbi:CopG family transcriptional regulator [bacterium]|nr:CopG family transcriptional regulator [bacterium]
MKKKIKYTNEPMKMGKKVKDFLPSPAELVLSEKTQRVTINLKESSLNAFKKEAKRLGVPYQKLLRAVVDLYTQNYFTS